MYDKWENTLRYMFNAAQDNSAQFKLARLLHLKLAEHTLDRTGTTETEKDYVICSPISEVSLNPIPLSDIMVTRGLEIMKDETRDIYLMWSGGMDSTGAFYALLNTGKHFNVIFNSKSVNEYADLGNKLINGYFENVTTMYNPKKFDLPEFIASHPNATIVTGELGDQTFGSDSMFKYYPEERKLNVLTAVENELLDKDVFEYTAPKVMLALGLQDFSNTTLAAYLWALNFIFKYQNVQLRFGYLNIMTNDPSGKNNGLHFYDTKEFNSYAMLNYKNNANFEKDTDYKMPLKEYIFSQNNDAVYRDTKIKLGSLRYTDYSIRK